MRFMSTNDWSTFYAVHEHTAYTEFPTGRYDIGTFEVKQYSFDNPKELYKEFTHWSKDSIDKMIFLDEKEANKAALDCTYKKLRDVRKKCTTQR